MCDHFTKNVLSNGQKKKFNWDMDWFLFEELQHPIDHSCVVYVGYRKFH
jgi:hypothetical protein